MSQTNTTVMLPKRKSTIQWNLESVTKAMAKRGKPVTREQAEQGAKMIFTVRGDGQVMAVKNGKNELVAQRGTGEVLQKKIFNTRVTSGVAMTNPLVKALLATAKSFEKSGGKDANGWTSSDYYNEFMNRTEISFSVLSSNKHYNNLRDGVDISAKLQYIENEETGGSIITLDESSIGLIALTSAGAGSFNLADYFGEDAPESADATAGAEVIGADELGALHTA